MWDSLRNNNGHNQPAPPWGIHPIEALKDGHLHAALDDAGGDGITGEAGGVVDISFLFQQDQQPFAYDLVIILLPGL